jgi:hypothetical protein
MGGPHVTEMADEALGRDGGPRHADAVALGEADATWPRIVEDAARGQLKDVYAPVDAFGQESKPSLKEYPVIPWQSIDLKQFNLVPKAVRRLLQKIGEGWGSFRIIPVESGRGCPYGCEFCTVTGFFGDSIRFRTNESVVNELLLLKARARSEKGQMAVFFIDDNFAINIKRTKSLLRDIIAAGAQVQLGGADQRQFVARRRTGGPDCGLRWQVDLYRHGVDRSGQSERREQGIQQAGRVCGGAGAVGVAQRVRHYVVYFWHGQRHGRSRRADAGTGWDLASGSADLWVADAFACNSALQAAGEGWAADAAQALAGVHSVYHGAHAVEDDH